MNSEDEKNLVFSSLYNLKAYERYKKIRVTHDYTVAERKLIKENSDEAKSINQSLPDNCDHDVRVIGDPKNGLRLMRIYRKKVVPPLTKRYV